MINPKHYVQSRRANGINYIFEYLEDGWIAIYEYEDGVPPKPIIQACNIKKAEEYVCLREPVPYFVRKIC